MFFFLIVFSLLWFHLYGELNDTFAEYKNSNADDQRQQYDDKNMRIKLRDRSL